MPYLKANVRSTSLTELRSERRTSLDGQLCLDLTSFAAYSFGPVGIVTFTAASVHFGKVSGVSQYLR